MNDSAFIDIVTRNKPGLVKDKDDTNSTSTSAYPGGEIEYEPLSDIANIDSNYAKVNDNSVWPCTSYFCITIEFITNTYPLFAG